MNASLSTKLLKLILSILIIPIVTMLVFYYFYVVHLIEKDAIALSNDVAIQTNDFIQSASPMQNELHKYIRHGNAHKLPDIAIIDINHTIIAASHDDEVGKKYPKHYGVVQHLMNDVHEGNQTSVYHDTQEQIFIHPILDTNHKIVAVGIYDYQELVEKKLAMVHQTFLFVIAIVFFVTFIAIVITVIFAYQIINPIKTLIEGTRILASGNLTYTIQKKSNDEIGILVDSFNNMVKKLNDSENALQKLNATLEQKIIEELQKNRTKEQLLIQQSKMASMGEMIANIAHQWRQPLNGLGLLIQNIETLYELDELDEEAIHYTVQTGYSLVNSMSATIDDFRNFFKPNKEKVTFSISKAVLAANRIVEASLKSRSIQLEMELNENIMTYGYPNEFSQVVINLINNAKDALEEARTITNKQILIRVYDDAGDACLSICDNGGGICEDIMNKLFDPYFTTKPEGKGTGIGLYMSKMIIETNMHGKLEVKNNDKGAVFTIKLPNVAAE